MGRSGCASATGKTGDSTGRAAIATSSASLATSCSARSCALDGPGTTARSPRPRRSGSSPRPTWAGRSGATCSSRSSSARTSEPRILASAGTERQRTHRALGADRRQGGRPTALARRREARRSIRPTWRSWPTSTAGPGSSRCASARRFAAAGHLDRPLPTASPSPSPRSIPPLAVGIDVEPIVERPRGLRSHGVHRRRNARSRPLVAAASRAEWIARFWCAKEAAAKATGLAGSRPARSTARSSEVDEASGVMHVKLGPAADRGARATGWSIPCASSPHRRGDYAWAWTLVEGADS